MLVVRWYKFCSLCTISDGLIWRSFPGQQICHKSGVVATLRRPVWVLSLCGLALGRYTCISWPGCEAKHCIRSLAPWSARPRGRSDNESPSVVSSLRHGQPVVVERSQLSIRVRIKSGDVRLSDSWRERKRNKKEIFFSSPYEVTRVPYTSYCWDMYHALVQCVSPEGRHVSCATLGDQATDSNASVQLMHDVYGQNKHLVNFLHLI